MDLSLNVGDTMGRSGGYPVVATIDSIFYRSGRKILRTTYENAGGGTLFFIEGVGPSFGMTYVQNVPNHLFHISLVCYYRDTTFEYHDNVIYPDWGCELSYEVGIEDNQRDVDALVTASPNPTTGIVSLDFKENGKYDVQVMTNQGNLIFKKKYFGDKAMLDMSRYLQGVYYIFVKDEKKIVIKKIIKI